MKIESLSYVSIETTDLKEWDDYAKNVVGLMKNESLSDDHNLYLRMDEKAFRFHIQTGGSKKFIAAGLNIRGKEEFEVAKNELTSANIEFADFSNELIAARCVENGITLKDPAGNALEISYGGADADEPFLSPQDIKGFITKGLGFGHVVFAAPDLEVAHSFYIDTLGFGDSDYMNFPMGPAPDAPEVKLHFMHCDNPRHHTVALYESPIPPSGLIHTMVEVNNVDEVGHGLDRALQNNVHISSSLGRHSNDMMVSFYMQTPSGFDLEFGYDGWQVDWETFTKQESKIPSFWVHAFSPPES